MGILGSVDAGPGLTRLLRDENERVQLEAIRSVGRVGYRAAFPELENLFRASYEDEVGELSLESIALLRAPEAIPLFESLLDSDEDFYRELSAQGSPSGLRCLVVRRTDHRGGRCGCPG